MYEHRRHPVAPFPIFARRVLRSLYLAATTMITALVIGVLGYHLLEDLS